MITMNIFIKPLFTFKKVTISLSNIVFVLLYVASLLFLVPYYIRYEGYMFSDKMLLIFFTAMYFLTASLVGLFLKVYELKYYVCPHGKQHYSLLLFFSRFVSWLLLFSGISYGAYVYEEYNRTLQFVGYIADGSIFTLLFYLFLKVTILIRKEP